MSAQDAAAQLEAAPPTIPTAEQCARIGILIGQFKPTDVCIVYEPFDLPKGWVLVMLKTPGKHTFTAGIDLDGRASS